MMSRVNRARRLAVLAIAVVGIVLCVGASSASATTFTYMTVAQSNGTAGLFGPRHTLLANTAYVAGGGGVCANAMNETGTSWVGTTQCNDILMSIGYCQCALRYPWAGTDPGGADPNHNMSAWEDY